MSHSHPADEARSKRLKQLSNVGQRVAELPTVLEKTSQVSEIGSRGGRSSSSPNVSSNVPEDLRVRWDECLNDDEDLNLLYGDGVSLVSGVGIGGTGMGTLLVRDEQTDSVPVNSDGDAVAGVGLPRRVLRSSSHKPRMSRCLSAGPGAVQSGA